MNFVAWTPTHSAEDALLREIAKLSRSDPFVGAKIGSNALTQQLLAAMHDERGAPLEALLRALGAIAGYSCQASVRAQAIARGLPEAAFLTSVQADDGKTYYFGDELAKLLAGSPYSIWAVASGGTMDSGLAEIVKHTSAAVGTAGFATPRVAQQNAADDSPLNYLRAFWPTVKPLIVSFCPNPEHWPVLIGLSIQAAINAGQSALDRGQALRLVMGAAIPMSTIDLEVPSFHRQTRRRARFSRPRSTAWANDSA